jgi:hypothetical protein
MSGLTHMDRVDQPAYRNVRNPDDRALFRDGLRTLFPACDETPAPEMEWLLKQLKSAGPREGRGQDNPRAQGEARRGRG